VRFTASKHSKLVRRSDNKATPEDGTFEILGHGQAYEEGLNRLHKAGRTGTVRDEEGFNDLLGHIWGGLQLDATQRDESISAFINGRRYGNIERAKIAMSVGQKNKRARKKILRRLRDDSLAVEELERILRKPQGESFE
jgi:hypothetical protein